MSRFPRGESAIRPIVAEAVKLLDGRHPARQRLRPQSSGSDTPEPDLDCTALFMRCFLNSLDMCEFWFSVKVERWSQSHDGRWAMTK